MFFNEEERRAPRVRMPQETWTRLWSYVNACPMEVGGLGTVDMVGGNAVISEVFLLKQHVGVAHTNLDPKAVREFVMDWVKAGKNPERLKFWWHSHATFPVGWSSTDEATIRRMTERTPLVSFVGNHKGDQRVRITTAAPERFVFDCLPLDVIPSVDEEAAKAAAEEVAAKVTQEGSKIWRWLNERPT
jgi:hypothetical protein